MRVFRFVSLSLFGVAAIACIIGVVVAARFAPPGPGDRVSTVALSGIGRGAVIAPRDLTCTRQPADQMRVTCRASVADRDLVVAVEQEPSRWGFRSCVATYAGKSTPCRSGFPPYAVVDAPSLGLSEANLQQLRDQHPLAYWQTADWRRAVLILAAIVALGVALVAGNIPAPHLLGRAVVATAGGLTTFVVTWAALGLYVITLGYFD